jgi:hypothetical protein
MKYYILDKHQRYLDINQYSWTWTTRIECAKIFNTREEAEHYDIHHIHGYPNTKVVSDAELVAMLI